MYIRMLYQYDNICWSINQFPCKFNLVRNVVLKLCSYQSYINYQGVVTLIGLIELIAVRPDQNEIKELTS